MVCGSMLAVWVPGPMELVIILAITLLVLGKRVPRLMGDLGRGIKEFGKGVREGIVPPEYLEDSAEDGCRVEGDK